MLAKDGYVLQRPPPETGLPKKQQTLKEWGIPVESDDCIFRLDDLEDFQSTNFDDLAEFDQRCLPEDIQKHGSNPKTQPGPASPLTYSFLSLDTSPLHNLLPQVRLMCLTLGRLC